jgi:Ca2+-binding RTX toxin-like protein
LPTYGVVAGQKPAGAIELNIGANYQQIVNNAPAGSTFWFAPGIHREVSIQPKDGDAFLGAPGAVLNGSELITSFTKSGSAWVISGQTQEGVRNLTDHTATGTQRGGYPETVFFDDKPLKPVDALSKLTEGSFYFDYKADKIYLGSDPTGHKVETGQSAVAFNGSADNVTISGLTIEKYSTPAQYSAVDGGSGEGWTIQNNEIRLIYGVGANVGTNGKIIGNYVHDNGEMGLDGGGANIVVQGNELARNGYWSGIDMSWEGGGTKFTETTNLLVKGNYSHDNAGNGLWTDINNYNTTYDGNLVIGNALGGISHEISYDAVIKNNTVIGNGYNSIGGGTQGNPVWLWGGQIQVHNSPNVEVYGNYVDSTNAGNGISLIEEDRGSGDRGAYLIRNEKIHDNIIVNASGNGGNGGESNINNAAYVSGGSSWNNNKFYGTDGHFNWGDAAHTYSQFEAATTGTNSFAAATSAPASPNLDQWTSESGAADTVTSPAVSPAPAPTPTPTQTPAPTPAPTTTAGPDILGNNNSNSLNGTSKGEKISGLGGNDTIDGKGGNDTISGGAGHDKITGGAGNDLLSGGAGNDQFIFKQGFGSDKIQDFYAEGSGTNHDVLVFSSTMFKDFSDVMAHAKTVGQNTVITLGSDQLTIVDTVKSEFHADHIWFV